MVSSYFELAGNSGIIYPNIKTNGAPKTGRESSENPNLQNVSKATNLVNPYTVPARQVFKAEKGHVLYFVDYAGIEMRLIVDACGCKPLRTIIDKGGDVHLPAAECFFKERFINCNDPIQRKTLRDAAKNAHFAIPYGTGFSKLVNILQVTLKEAERGFNEYAEKYPEVAYFTRNIVKEVKDKGYIETPFGRRLYVLKNKAYMGANYKIQGYAAGVIKRAQVFVDEYLAIHWPEVRLVIPIHDELIISCPLHLVRFQQKILSEISKIMINIPGVNIRLDVEWKRSFSTWDKAKKIKVEY
jgi:DNA polymerase-1